MMDKKENKTNKKCVTFKIAGETQPTPNPIYDCEIPIYPVDFPCQHIKPCSWWDKTLTFTQLRDLYHIWYNELEENYVLFQNQVKNQNQIDLVTCTNRDMVILLANDLRNACILERTLECELEILSHHKDCLQLLIERFEKLYSCPMNENQCKLFVYRMFEPVQLKLMQTKYNLEEVQLESSDRVISLNNKEPMGQILSIVNIFICNLNKLLEKVNEMERLLNSITEKKTKYIATVTQYAQENDDFELLMDIEKFKKNAP